jgi:hypothetical protein
MKPISTSIFIKDLSYMYGFIASYHIKCEHPKLFIITFHKYLMELRLNIRIFMDHESKVLLPNVFLRGSNINI